MKLSSIGRINLLIFVVGLTCLLPSCTNSYQLVFRKDGSVVVKTDLDWDSGDIERFRSAPCIAGLDSLSSDVYSVSYTINSIDSVGHYLPHYPIDFFHFETKNDTLIIQDREEKWMCYPPQFLHHYYVVCKTDREIQTIEVSSGDVKKIDEHTLLLRRTRRNIVHGKHSTNVKVFFSK